MKVKIIYKKKNKIVFEEKEIEFIKKKYSEGLSQRDIAKLLNVNVKTIGKAMKEHNISVRSDREQALKYTCNEKYFETIDTESKAYWLGFIYADGYILSKRKYGNRKLGIAISEKDEEHLYRFKKDINSNCLIKKYSVVGYNNQNSNYVRVLLTSKKLTDDIEKLGVFEHKTEILKFPTKKQVPISFLSHFIRGYLDGDGCITKTTKGFRIRFCGTKEFLEGIQKYFHTSVKMEKRHKDKVNNYAFSIGGNRQAEKILNILYNNATVYLQRKYNKYQELIKTNKQMDIILEQKNIKYENEKQQIVNKYLKIKNISQLAQQLNISTTKISYILKEKNII